MKKFRSLQQNFLESLQIPKDLAQQESLVTCSGCSEILVENYRKILEYQNSCIRILLKRGKMRIEGDHLTIDYYCQDEMKITGFIQAVFFE
ncbi:MAG: YabP/YqfC family sporulation protein [Ruminococcus sp.]